MTHWNETGAKYHGLHEYYHHAQISYNNSQSKRIDVGLFSRSWHCHCVGFPRRNDHHQSLHDNGLCVAPLSLAHDLSLYPANMDRSRQESLHLEDGGSHED